MNAARYRYVFTGGPFDASQHPDHHDEDYPLFLPLTIRDTEIVAVYEYYDSRAVSGAVERIYQYVETVTRKVGAEFIAKHSVMRGKAAT
jgi:hypothetical protein